MKAMLIPMKKIVCLLLSLMLTIFPSFANDQYNKSEYEPAKTVDSIFQKIHFFHNVDYYNLNNENEFNLAFSSIKALYADKFDKNNKIISAKDSTVFILMEFDNNIQNTLEYQKLSNEKKFLTNVDSVHEWRSRLNAFGLKYHNELIQKQITQLDLSPYSSCNLIEYTPFVTLSIDINNFTENHVLELADYNFVKSISISDYTQINSDSTTSQDALVTTNSNTTTWYNNLTDINAYNIISSGAYTGTDIHIGIFEGNGVCDKNHEMFNDIDITIHPNSTNIGENHATKVTSVLTAIAPDAKYYVAKITDVSTNMHFCNLSWFIDNACDIINCSFSFPSSLSYTSFYDGYFDYVAQTYCITIVKSAGNTGTIPSKKICSPGYAYNVITVGGVSRTTINSIEYLQYDDGACYISDIGQTIKPDIAAPFYVDIPNIGVYYGTSYSTPIVSGCIALLYEKFNNYMPYPELTKSLIASTATKTYGYIETNGGLDTKVGAGCINLNNMMNCTNYIRKFVSTTDLTYDVHSKIIYLSKNQTLNTAISWLITASASGTDLYITDFNLEIFNSDGERVAESMLDTSSNVELIRYTIPSTGAYTIKVTMTGGQNSNISSDCVILTYNVQ